MSGLSPVEILTELTSVAERLGVLQNANGHAETLTFSAADLHGMDFAPLPWAVPGLLPQGAALLCGPPKAGKSRLVLGLAAAIAYGGIALSHTEVAKGGVL